MQALARAACGEENGIGRRGFGAHPLLELARETQIITTDVKPVPVTVETLCAVAANLQWKYFSILLFYFR